MKHFSDKDFLSGLMFVLIGVFGAFMVSSFAFGSTARPGPGFFPVVLSWTLMIVGAAVADLAGTSAVIFAGLLTLPIPL